ncbi:alpha/beta hydrolase [Dactylosporangium sp. CA-092794]|uniref:alpha/beta hydrolase n=1 Tax=Dactylosporangium sp. CA-092794 TaxID=3239929 RepID=UPI003D8A9CED
MDSDALELRAAVDTDLARMFAALPVAPGVVVEEYSAKAADGTMLPLRWYRRAGSAAASAVVYVHGGGMICGSPDLYDPVVRLYAGRSGVPFLAPGYRRAPEARGSTPVEDVHTALRWLHDHAGSLRIDVGRIAVMGDSAGGGLAAGAAVLAREHGPRLARQILVYPMLDDRTTAPDPVLAPLATWTYDFNRIAWRALLGDDIGGARIPPAVAPGRLTDFRGLPPAYVEVGEHDIFRDESIAYAGGLHAAGVSCELHVHPGSPHGHDWRDPQAPAGRRAIADRLRVIGSL